MASPLITIGVLSHLGQKGLDAKEAVLDTWGGDALGNADTDILFLIGDPELKRPERRGIDLYLPCPDGYKTLPQKVRWFCLWALAHTDSPWLFKADDDTYVRIDRLVQLVKTKGYSRKDGWNRPMAGCRGGRGWRATLIGGAGYVLSREGAMLVAAHCTNLEGAEDRQVRRSMNLAGTRHNHERLFYYRRSLVPQPDNEQVTSCEFGPYQMRRIHKTFQQGG